VCKILVYSLLGKKLILRGGLFTFCRCDGINDYGLINLSEAFALLTGLKKIALDLSL